MESIRSPTKLSVELENDNLIMFGSAYESSGCVLRGVLRFTLTQPLKVKSISVRFTGKSLHTWSEVVGNGQEQLCHEDEHTVVDHHFDCLPRQSKLYTLPVGNHSYHFEFVLKGSLPETTHVINFYQVEYKLKALVERPAFIPNQSARQVVHLSRQLYSPHSPEFMEPVYMVKRYQNDLESIISLPAKIYAYGDTITLSIVISALHDHLQLDSMTCNLKEYIILGNSGVGTLTDNARAHGRHLFSTKVNQFSTSTTTMEQQQPQRHVDSEDNNNNNLKGGLTVWAKQFDVVLPSTGTEMHCDMDNDMVRVRHKFKFILDFHHTQTGHSMQLRTAVPVNICALSLTTQQLPAYESASFDLAYDPNIAMGSNTCLRLPTQRNTGLPTYLEALNLGSDYEEHPPPLVF
ncbi:hypothetical protein BCR42DRAFT_360180 [Absidia repens]|uniref:Uncharacterized protein n=1 Tax=Absidia repens TaxID=90262 RepID=A0A1X2I3S4_9FUNG|nr:hypothetical protein BCR42DRAFT_360180 [Absidia repens]